MKFNIFADHNDFISHIVLHDTEVVTALSKSDRWVKDKETVAKITVNDIEIPFEKIEAYFQDLYGRLIKKAHEQYADLDKEVQRRLEKRLEEEVEPIRNKLYEVYDTLTSAGDLLTPYWERNRDSKEV